jgi:hypothetical protein
MASVKHAIQRLAAVRYSIGIIEVFTAMHGDTIIPAVSDVRPYYSYRGYCLNA